VPVFVDTNVFVYRFDVSEPEKQIRCEAWLRQLWNEGSGRVSVQVLCELYVTLTRKLDRPLPRVDAQAVVRSLFAWQPAVVDRSTVEAAWQLQERYALSWWDALIVAAAQTTGSSILLTEDLGHDHVLGAVRAVNPFRVEPGRA